MRLFVPHEHVESGVRDDTEFTLMGEISEVRKRMS